MNLKLNALYLLFDLAFYVKAQQVHWNDVMYMQRTFVRPGDFSVLLESALKIRCLLTSDLKLELSLPEVMKGRYHNSKVGYKNYGWSFGKETLIYFHGHSAEEKDEFIALAKSLCFSQNTISTPLRIKWF